MGDRGHSTLLTGFHSVRPAPTIGLRRASANTASNFRSPILLTGQSRDSMKATNQGHSTLATRRSVAKSFSAYIGLVVLVSNSIFAIRMDADAILLLS